MVLRLLLRFLSGGSCGTLLALVIVGGRSLTASEEVGFGTFEQGEFGAVDDEDDSGADHGVADLDDLAVGASFGACLAGSGSHVGGPVRVGR